MKKSGKIRGKKWSPKSREKRRTCVKIRIASVRLPDEVSLTEEGEEFTRLVGERDIVRDKKTGKRMIKPTVEDEVYASKLDIKRDLKGFFAGDPDEWGPVLIRDQFLPTERGLYLATLKFPKGTPYFKGRRPVTMERQDDFIDEQFVVYDKPIRPVKLRELTSDEYEEYDRRAEELSKDPDWDEDD